MGSINEDVPKEPSNVTVLVTGFAPFQDRFPINPSYEITRLLPKVLPNTTVNGRRVEIVPYVTPIRVCYSEVRSLVPALLGSLHDAVDLVLHIGMASGRHYYSAEMYAHREGYSKNKDVDGEFLSPDDGITNFKDCPLIMTTALDCDDILRKWRLNLTSGSGSSLASPEDCILSEDAGNYLCDYIYFNSLAWCGRRSGRLDGGKASDRPVLFLHVPAESDPAMLEKGQQVVMALIEAMVENWCSSEGLVHDRIPRSIA